MPKNESERNAQIHSFLPISRKQRAVYESAGAVASTSQSASQSTQSTSNVAAFSAAAKLLNDVVDGIDIDADISQCDDEIIDYIGNLEHHPRRRLPDNLSPVELSYHSWQLVSFAARCARNVHDKQQSETTFIKGNLDGSTRGFGIYEKVVDNETLMIIAFQATRTLMGWMANTNADSIACEELGSGFGVHKGLTNMAKKTQHLLAAELEKHVVKAATPINILFTGHSGGGAIAQLLFGFMTSETSVLSRFQSNQNIVSINCITFGSPPVSNPPISHLSTKKCTFISFLNEGDPVTLAEPDYLQFLVQAWLEPSPTAENDSSWDHRSPRFTPSGKLAVLGSSNEQVTALYIDATNLITVLFGNPLCHSMKGVYLPRIEKLFQQAASQRQNPFCDPASKADSQD